VAFLRKAQEWRRISRGMTDNDVKENIALKKLISKHQFYFDIPLYDLILLKEIGEDLLKGDVDGYNSVNGFDTTYDIDSRSLGMNYNSYSGYYLVTLTCKRTETTRLRFFIYTNERIIVKLGQYPSLADIQFAEIGEKYDKVLDKDSLFEFKRAIGLAAHGTGVGSIVYLRRIFEKLISQAFQNNKASLGIEEKDFVTKRMEDKVEILKNYLPSQLVELKSVYKILSKGLHELSEKECLAYFEPLKLSIELILDQKIEMYLKKERDEKVKQEVQNIHKALGK
jgi:hypothetical protein